MTRGYATRDLLVSCSPTHVFDTVDDVMATLAVGETFTSSRVSADGDEFERLAAGPYRTRDR